MKKVLGILLAIVVVSAGIIGLVSCTNKNTTGKAFDTSKNITVVSREEGSGTRGAFVELFKVEEKDASGTKVDNTIASADISNSTGVMMSNVAGNPYAIGYISLGSLNDTVKAVTINGVTATAENIKNGSYEVSRPFMIATKGEVSQAAQDFINYIMSKEGQAVIENNGYITASENAQAFTSGKPSGKVTISGSSSVTPVMEKLREAYLTINPNASIEINESDSTAGMTDVANGVSEIGMASRDLKTSETDKGLTGTKIALDGIAVVVNTQNTVSNLSIEQVKAIYTGTSTVWSDVAA